LVNRVTPTKPDTDIPSQFKLEINTDGNRRRMNVVEVVKGTRPNEISLRSGIMDLRSQ
jgi:hypothetical protein